MHGDARPGIGLDFGSDLDSFSRAIDVLGLDRLVHDEASDVAVHTVITSDTPGHTLYMGESARLAQDLPLVETVKALQVANITRSGHTTLSYPLSTSAKVIVGHAQDGHTDTSRPVVVLGSTWHNTPSLRQRNPLTGEYEDYDTDELFSVGEALDGKDTRKKYTAIMESAKLNEYLLRPPEQQYSIKIGKAIIYILDIASATAGQWYDVPRL